MLWHIAQEQRSEEELKEALYNKSESVRAVAADVLASRLSDKDLKDLLEDYPNARTTFWYNVVAVLDEHLYAPSKAHIG